MSKEKSPAFQFYAAEYLADENVQVMSIEDEGCYIRLLCYCWREGSIPSDLDLLSRMCKGTKPSSIVTGCFKRASENAVENGRLIHARLEKYRVDKEQWKEKSSLGGKRSAHKRKHPKEVTTEQGGSTTVPRVVQPKGNTSSSSSTSINNTTHKGRRAPEDFRVTEEMRQWAKSEVPDADLDAETRLFMDHEFEKPKSDWLATWRNWLRNSTKFKGRPTSQKANGKSCKPDTVGQASETESALRLPEFEALIAKRSKDFEL